MALAANELESAFIGCLLASPAILADCRDAGFHPSMIYSPTNGRILTAIEFLGAQADIATVTTHLRDSGHLDAIGGPSAVTQLLISAPIASQATTYIPKLREKWMARSLVSACKTAIDGMQEGDDVEVASSRLVRDVTELLDAGTEIDPDRRTMRERVMDFVDHIEALYDKGDSITGMRFGLTDFDAHTGGMQPAELWVVCGHTKSGKTSLAMQALEVAAKAGIPSSLFSLEMTSHQTIGRMVASAGGLDGGYFRKPRLMNQHQFGAFQAGSTRVGEYPVFIHERKRSLGAICSALRRDKRLHDIRLAVVDYAQLVDGDASPNENREREVAKISGTMKALAKELSIPVVLLSQTNDDGKLRESRAIGQDADCVIRVTVPPKEDDRKNPDLASPERKIVIEYARSFGAESFAVRFINSQTRFEDKLSHE